MLWSNSQESWRQFLVRCFDDHAAATPKGTKEAAVDDFVSLHNGCGASAKTGLHFNPASVTEANRMKANCATFYRYVEKEELFDMLPYILGSMQEEQRLAFLSQYLQPAGVAVRPLEVESIDAFGFEEAAATTSAACKAMDAMTKAAIHPTPENIAIAEREVEKAHVRFKRTRAVLAAAGKACKGARAVVGRLVHRKEKVAP